MFSKLLLVVATLAMLGAVDATCDGSAITHANAARSGGDATGTPLAAAGTTEATGSTIIFTCTYSTTTITYTCRTKLFLCLNFQGVTQIMRRP